VRGRIDFVANDVPGGRFIAQGINEEYVASGGAYLQGTVQAGDWLDVQPGVAWVGVTGDPLSIEPRLRIHLKPFGDGTQFNLAGGYYTQTFEGISDEEDAGTVFTAWVPNPTDNRSSAIHAIAGVEQEIRPGLTASVEGYRKWIRDIPAPSWSRIARFTTAITSSDAYSYGIDVRASYDRGSLYGFVGYGYSVTRYIVSNAGIPGARSVSERTYRPPHDQRHRFNTVVEWEPRWATFNVSWQFSTGLPYTQLLGFDALLDLRDADYGDGYGTPRFLFKNPYNRSLPPYHRLDVSVARTFEVGLGTFEVKAGGINVYDRLNVFYYNIFERNRVDQLPFAPYVALHVDIG
jgi:hypothetical protein